MSYNYYYFESPYKAWVIATAPEECCDYDKRVFV
ncbi:hypothetical protein IGI43_003312 [Enterococcus sp. AZ126]